MQDKKKVVRLFGEIFYLLGALLSISLGTCVSLTFPSWGLRRKIPSEEYFTKVKVIFLGIIHPATQIQVISDVFLPQYSGKIDESLTCGYSWINQRKGLEHGGRGAVEHLPTSGVLAYFSVLNSSITYLSPIIHTECPASELNNSV